MIDGLKLTMPGDVLKARVAGRIRLHESAVERYRADLKMDPKDQSDERPLLPDHILESMIDERLDRIAALTLIRDHVVSGETYLLDKSDLQFAEMLPPPPEPEWPDFLARQIGDQVARAMRRVCAAEGSVPIEIYTEARIAEFASDEAAIGRQP